MDRSDISGKLKTFLETECRVAVPTADAGLDIDSFNMMLIITYAGEELGAELNMDSLNFDALMSLDSLSDLIAKECSAV
jgi:acyl carrier protein